MTVARNRNVMTHTGTRRPRTPLLFVLLGSAALFAATSFIAANIEITTQLMESVTATVLAAAVGSARLFVR